MILALATLNLITCVLLVASTLDIRQEPIS